MIFCLILFIKTNEIIIILLKYIYNARVKRGHTYRCLRVRDNRMHTVINDGFIIFIALNGNNPLKLERKIVSAQRGNNITLKYLIPTKKEYILQPYYIAEYKPIVLSRIAPNPIIGKVALW